MCVDVCQGLVLCLVADGEGDSRQVRACPQGPERKGQMLGGPLGNETWYSRHPQMCTQGRHGPLLTIGMGLHREGGALSLFQVSSCI